MRRFAQAAVVAAAMSAPVFAGVMIAPQAQADSNSSYPQPRVLTVSVLQEKTLPDGTVTTFYVYENVMVSSAQGAKLVKQTARAGDVVGPGKASSSPTTAPGPNQSPPGPKP